MPVILNWLAQHRSVHLLIVAAYFLLVVLPHEWMGKWIYATFFEGDIDQYNLRFLSFMLLGAFVVVIPFILYLKQQQEGRLRTIGYLMFTISLMLLAYFTIFVLATELVHFPQYALMAILLFPLSWRFTDTLFWSTLLGALDEAYQYFYIAPQRTDYYDFNDVIINFLGAAFGLVFIRTISSRLPAPPARDWQRSPIVWTLTALLILLTAAVFSGRLAIYPDQLLLDTGWLLVKEVPESFWSDFHHIRYHVILPEEGISLLILLFIIYSGLGKTSTKKLV